MAQLDREALNEIDYMPRGYYSPNRFITAQFMEAITGVPHKTLYDWRKKGWVRAVEINDRGKRLLFDLDHFNAVLDSRLTEEVAYEGSLNDE